MSTLRALLELYGSLDSEVTRSRDASTRDVAEQLLAWPGRRRGLVSRARTVHVPGRRFSQADPDRGRLERSRTRPGHCGN